MTTSITTPAAHASPRRRWNPLAGLRGHGQDALTILGTLLVIGVGVVGGINSYFATSAVMLWLGYPDDRAWTLFAVLDLGALAAAVTHAIHARRGETGALTRAAAVTFWACLALTAGINVLHATLTELDLNNEATYGKTAVAVIVAVAFPAILGLAYHAKLSEWIADARRADQAAAFDALSPLEKARHLWDTADQMERADWTGQYLARKVGTSPKRGREILAQLKTTTPAAATAVTDDDDE